MKKTKRNLNSFAWEDFCLYMQIYFIFYHVRQKKCNYQDGQEAEEQRSDKKTAQHNTLSFKAMHLCKLKLSSRKQH